MTTPEGYNGWANWETWEAYNWLTADEYTYDAADHIVHSLRPYRRQISELRELVKDATAGQDIDRRRIIYSDLIQSLRGG